MIKKFFTVSLFLSAVIFSSCSSDDSTSGPIDIIIEGAEIAPQIGGPNEPNQVYIDLNTKTTTVVKRDIWDLGFYSGAEFRVVLNGSIYMAAAELTATDINAVNSSTPQVMELQPKVAVGTFEAASSVFIDAPTGDISKTVISEISNTDLENHVYLINLGDEIGTKTPATGATDVSGERRGWKKIRILRDGEDYILQYADLDATEHTEITISKNKDYHFTFFSFNTENEVNVEPTKNDWDLNFTVFSNVIPSNGAYGYSDFVVNNSKSNAKAYMVNSEVDSDLIYDTYALSDVDAAKFTNDQRGIGSTWRKAGGPDSLPTLYENVFYVVKDTDGKFYKLKFLALTNEDGERGYPEFVYTLLQ